MLYLFIYKSSIIYTFITILNMGKVNGRVVSFIVYRSLNKRPCRQGRSKPWRNRHGGGTDSVIQD